MEPNILENGTTTKPMAGVNYCMPMETSMKVSGTKIWLMVRVNTLMQMEQCMMVIGTRTNSMAWELSHGQMELSMRVSLTMDSKKEMGNSYLQRDPCIKASLGTMRSMVKEFTNGLTGRFTRGSGLTTR